MIFIFFLLVFLFIYFLIHYYVYSKFTKGLQIRPRVCNYLKILFLIGAFSFIIGEILSRYISVYPGLYFGAFWLGIISISFLVFVLKDILGLFLLFTGKFATLVVRC